MTFARARSSTIYDLLSPPLILNKGHIDDIFGILKDAIQSVN